MRVIRQGGCFIFILFQEVFWGVFLSLLLFCFWHWTFWTSKTPTWHIFFKQLCKEDKDGNKETYGAHEPNSCKVAHPGQMEMDVWVPWLERCLRTHLFIFTLSSAWLMSSSKATFLAAQTLVQINFAAVCLPQHFSPEFGWQIYFLNGSRCKAHPNIPSVSEEGVNLIWETKGKERQKCVWDIPNTQWDLQNSLMLLFFLLACLNILSENTSLP